MAARAKLGAQVAAVALVGALFALLVWRLATQERSSVPRAIEQGAVIDAPDFSLARLDAPGELSLSSLRGKAVLVNFWASWCAPCKEEAPFLERTWRKHRADGLVVLGVDFNDVDTDARRFARKHGLSFPLVRDRKGEVVGRYGGTGVPETYFVDRRGKLVASIKGSVTVNAEVEARFRRNVELALAT
ncbi:MAG: redoxin domain-containing protein [Actinobacteria bacterium]|nr:redoxin domain-containing protein [Actinomycetota bacterium]